jgi:hypothetical protein
VTSEKGRAGLLLLLLLLLLLGPSRSLVGQEKPEPAVSGYVAGYFGLTPDDESVPIGVVGLDHKSWHFLARYGYEDRDTFSAWAGRVFELGDKVAVALTPMVGVAVGLTDGIAPGLEFALDWGRLSVYNESELVIPFDGSASYFYAWGNTSYRVADWFQPGLSIQRLRVFESEREVDRGLSVGAEFGRLAVTVYGYNPFNENRFWQLGVEVGF